LAKCGQILENLLRLRGIIAIACDAIACLFKDTRGGFSQQNRQPAQNLPTKPARSNQKPNIGATSDLMILI